MRTAGSLCIGNSAMAASLPDGSRVRRESHARFCERLEVKSLRPTHPTVPILAKGKAVKGRIWTYVRDDQPFGGRAPWNVRDSTAVSPACWRDRSGRGRGTDSGQSGERRLLRPMLMQTSHVMREVTSRLTNEKCHTPCETSRAAV